MDRSKGIERPLGGDFHLAKTGDFEMAIDNGQEDGQATGFWRLLADFSRPGVAGFEFETDRNGPRRTPPGPIPKPRGLTSTDRGSRLVL